MIFTIRNKLSLGVGTLTGLLLVSGLVSYLQIHVVEERLVEVLEVDEPSSAAAYEMEINLIGTGFGLLGYLHDHDPVHLDRIRKDQADFAHHLQRHRALIEHNRAEFDSVDSGIRDALMVELEQRYATFAALATRLIAIEDEQTAKTTALLEALGKIDTLLDDKIQTAITPDTPQAYEKLSAALDLEINANGIAKGLGSFLRTHLPEYEDRVHKDERDFAEHLEAYRSLRLSAQEKKWAEEAETLFDESVGSVKGIISLDKEKEQQLAEFIQIRRALDALLDDRIQVATHEQLHDAKAAAHAAVERLSLLTVGLLAAGILVGGLTGVMVVRSIVRPVSKLVAATRALALGDSTQRVEIESADELGQLGAAFNQMLDARQAADERLRRAKQAAESANVAKTEFLANMSHELRTPMNSILGFTQRLIKKLNTSLDERDLDALTTVDRNAKHLLRLINDVLDLSKIEAGKMELNGMEFDLRGAVQEVVERSRSLVDGKPIELQIELPDRPVSVFADPVKIAQIITNLLSNAVRYTEQGEVVISVERVDDPMLGPAIALRVADSGVGIKEEHIARLFDKFTQVDGSTTRRVDGTGLGLAITGQLVELHGGRIDVQSVYGSGSTFTCILPITVPEPGIEDPAPAQPVSAGDRLTVLCVDDEPDILKFMKVTLEEAGYEVVLATSHDWALYQARRRRPDLICLDMHMPGKGGVDVIQSLKASPLLADVPVLVVSAHNERAAMIQLGARGFLDKPIAGETFVSAIHDILVQQLGSVLIVEDDTDTAKLLKNSVSDYGVEVHVAGNGEEALAYLAKHRPSVIVVDLVMPVMNGFELIERLEQTPARRSTPAPPIPRLRQHPAVLSGRL